MRLGAEALFAKAGELSAAGQAFVLCTLLSSRGHAPQEAGAKALLTADGLIQGTIGGGKVEARAITYAKELLLSQVQAPLQVDWDLQRDVGMSCGGCVELLFEVFGTRPWHITIFGAGHVAQALCRVLATLSCQVQCVDTRAEWIERLPGHPRLEALVVENLAAFAQDLRPGTACVVVTMGHSTDLPILAQVLHREDLSFIGSIGSKVKARAIKADLMRLGLSPEALARLHCPIGIELGSRLPEEIAISICAQLLQHRPRQN